MTFKKIGTKLWLSSVLLVIVILFFSSLSQAIFLEDLYYNQEFNQLFAEAETLAANLSHQPSLVDFNNNLKLLADLMDANVMVIDRNGFIKSCHGMGINIPLSQNSLETIMPYHKNNFFRQEDIYKVIQGDKITQIGKNPLFGVDTLSVGVPIKVNNEVTGAVLIHAPLSSISGKAKALQKVTLYSAVGGIILATLLSLVLSRSMSKPLENMNEIALAMAAGDYTKKIDVKSEDEIGILANSLNNLASQLNDKIKTLEQVDQTRKDFVANVSHELRTPLSIIQGYAEVLHEDVVTSEAEKKRYLQNILEETERLKRLTNELLDLRKLETGHLQFELYPVLLTEIVEQVCDKFQGIAKDKEIKLDWKIPKKLNVKANRDRLEQVFINLLDNAFKATGHGGSICITAKQVRNFAEVSIKDTGGGIPEEEIPFIWDRFYKVDKARSRKNGEGTGLGLAIVKRIIEAHEGTINVKSKINEGTEFTFLIPLA